MLICLLIRTEIQIYNLRAHSICLINYDKLISPKLSTRTVLASFKNIKMILNNMDNFQLC